MHGWIWQNGVTAHAPRPVHEQAQVRLRILRSAPVWLPLRLAEDFATADILTTGRFTYGVGAMVS